jgi:adenosylhomocysteine nucleosidase
MDPLRTSTGRRADSESVADPLLIVVPTETEQAHLVAALAKFGATAEQSKHGRLATCQLSSLNAVIAPGGLGKTQFAVQTQHLLTVREWRLVICAGSAGSLSDELSTGDIVIATETVEHDVRKVARPTMPRFSADESLIVRCRGAVQDLSNVRVQFGAIASGDEDIVGEARRAELRASTGAVAVAWEGAGGARACQFSGVAFLEVRGITDIADANGPRDFAQHLAMTMQNVALVVSRIASS